MDMKGWSRVPMKDNSNHANTNNSNSNHSNRSKSNSSNNKNCVGIISRNSHV